MENKEYEIRKIAKYIRKKYNLPVPIEFDNIIAANKCILIEENMRSLGDGYTDFNSKPPKIAINNQVTYIPRKKFTIAHELGHIFISWHDDITICQTDNYMISKNLLDIQEREANVFASELLLPEEWVREQIDIYKDLPLNNLLNVLSTLSGASIFACLYALENVLDSGNVIIMRSTTSEYGKKFVARDTCNTWFRSLDTEDVCEWLAQEKVIYSIGSYELNHYQLSKCPTYKEIQDAYQKYGENIEATLYFLSNCNILNILHCMKTIIDAFNNNYYIAVYNNDKLFLTLASEGSNLRVEYCESLKEAMEYCKYRFTDYGEITLNSGMIMLWIKEPSYYENNNWTKSTIDSKQLLKNILYELYIDSDAVKNLHSINGLIGYANGSNKGASRTDLYNIFKMRLQSKKGLEKFIKHKDFDKFISLRISEILNRQN